LRKTLNVWLSICLALIISVPAFAASASARMQDTQGHWAQQAIDKWNDYGVISGFNGNFRPNEPITRAEFAILVNNINKYVVTGPNTFSDLDPAQWYADALLKLQAAGVMNGSDGKALPERPITRQEAAVIINKAFQPTPQSGSTPFKDQSQIAAWAKDAIANLSANQIMNGFPDGTFHPLNSLTRAEAVSIFNSFVQVLIHEPGEYSKDVSGNLLVNTKDVVLSKMKISGDLIIAQGVGEGEVTLNDVEIAGSVYVRGGGEHSIIFNNVDVRGSLVVNKYDGKVRILATGSTQVSVTRLESGALLVSKELTGGGFETVEISADIAADSEIVLDGNFNTVVNRSTSGKITVNGSIQELVAEVDTKIVGDVEIKKVTASESVSTRVNDQIVQPGSGVTPPNSNPNPGPSSGTPGSDNGDGGDNTTVPVTGISLGAESLTMYTGETKQLTATVLPGNATNKNATWSVADNSTDVITVNQSGLVTAVGTGTKTIQVVTQDGGKSAAISVTVHYPAFAFDVSAFTGDAVDQSAGLDGTIVANSGKLNVVSNGKSLLQANRYEAIAVATGSLAPSSEPNQRIAYLRATLKDGSNNPIVDTSSVTLTVTQATYDFEPKFGVGIAEASKPGSFLIPINVGNPESIQQVTITAQQAQFSETSLSIELIPAGFPYVQGIGAISGATDIGSELTAGAVQYGSGGASQNAAYQWYRSDSVNGSYTAISGAEASTYTITEADSEQYLRVAATGDHDQIGGMAVSAAFGPVKKAVTGEDIFDAIAAKYLGSNKDSNSIVSNLDLVTSLPAFPGVTISWQSDKPAVISTLGVVTRDDANDQFVKLTATLGGAASGTKSFELIVRSKGTEQVEIGDIDPYFVEGYPQAYVQDGTIRVRYKLNKPAEVFMIVNVINGRWESDVRAVLEGRSGDDNIVINVDSWPYFKIEANQVNQLQEFDTGIALRYDAAHIDFVIRDTSADYTSNKVTSIKFDQKTVEAVDTFGPYSYTYYINKARDAIYIYYNEEIDLSSKPDASDYQLSGGTVQSVELHNYPDAFSGAASSYVKLNVSGIPDLDSTPLTFAYTGTAIRDLSDAKNKAGTITNQPIKQIDTPTVSAKISTDRKAVTVTIQPGWNPKDNTGITFGAAQVQAVVADNGNYTPKATNYGYSTSDFTLRMNFENPLPAGDTIFKLDTSGLRNWAMDLYPDEIATSSAVQLEEPGTPTAVYDGSRITLTFANNFEFSYESFAAGLVVKVDGAEYELRGFIAVPDYNNKNVLNIELTDNDYNKRYAQHVKQAIDNGTNVQIKYVKKNGDGFQQLSDSSNKLLPDFDYVTVVK